MDRFNFQNIIKGWFTSIIGLLVIGAGIYQLYQPMPSITEVIGLIALGLGLLGIKDPRLRGSGKTAAVVVIASFFFLSCSVRQVPVTVTVRDTVAVPVTVITPPDTVRESFNIDSLLAASVKDTAKIISENGRAQIKFWKDQYNNQLTAEAICLPDTIEVVKEVPIEIVKEVEVECPGKEPNPGKRYRGIKGKFRWLWDQYTILARYVLLALVIIFFIKRRR
ncbi:MAG: hypothetical protein ACFB2Y_16960 [Fulvivirga sp.]